ncbi:MAG: hydrogenase maturation protease [Gammaproteobacteria bacterium]|nr:hydrogenase maturation protease [Gammaproteobacteria bacterium]
MTGVLTRVIGIGQPAAGDDYAGIAVARAVRAQQLPADVDIHEITDPALLVELLDGIQRAILIDALVSGNSPGNIMRLTPEDLAANPVTPLSSHGTSVTEALGLLRILAPETTDCDIHIIGITIDQPTRYSHAMSAPVAAAVPRAAGVITRLLKSKKTLSSA